MTEETIVGRVSDLLESTGAYIEAKSGLWKLQAADKTAELGSTFIAHLVTFTLVSFLLIFLSIACALCVGKWLGELYYGFFVIAGCYTIAGLLLYATRATLLKTPLYNRIIKKLVK